MFTFDFIVHTQLSEFIKLYCCSINIEAQFGLDSDSRTKHFNSQLDFEEARLHFHVSVRVSSSFDSKSATKNMERSEKKLLYMWGSIECTHIFVLLETKNIKSIPFIRKATTQFRLSFSFCSPYCVSYHPKKMFFQIQTFFCLHQSHRIAFQVATNDLLSFERLRVRETELGTAV